MKITNGKRFAIGMLAATWLGVTAICASVEPGRAATVFDLTGTFADSSAVSGALTIDLVTGQIVGANLFYGTTFSTILSQGPFTGETSLGQTAVPVSYFVAVGNSASLLPRIALGIPGSSAVDSLVAYTGGSLCSLDAPCGPDQRGGEWASDVRFANGTFLFLQTGELTSAVPLPAALPLFAAGLGAMGLLGWRRKRRAVSVRRALTATVVIVGLSPCANVAQATPVVFQLTLNQTFPDIETNQGTFSIDSAFLTPNTQINFVNFLSFSMAIEGFHFTLSHALLPATEGVLTDASGAVVRFNDSAATILTEFCSAGTGSSSCPIFLVFHDGTSPPFYSTSGGDSGGDTQGTYSISVVSNGSEIPLPAALPLFAAGLAVMGLLGWRRKRLASAAALAVAMALSSPAATKAAVLDFNFSFTNAVGGGGTVTGTIRGLLDDATGPATSVEVTGNTDGFGIGEYVGVPSFNSWSVSAGVIVAVNFRTLGANNTAPDVTCCTFALVTITSLLGTHASLRDTPSAFLIPPNISDISFTPAAVPLPAALPLFAAGLGVMGLLGWRRRARRVSAA